MQISSSNLYSMLNYTDYVCAVGSTGIGVFGEGTGPVWLSKLRCENLDKHLDECRGNKIKNNPCSHIRDAAVICQGICHSNRLSCICLETAQYCRLKLYCMQ